MDGPDYHWQRKRVSYLCVYVEKPRVSLWKMVFADFPDFCQILPQISHAVNEGNSRVVQEGAPTPSSSFPLWKMPETPRRKRGTLSFSSPIWVGSENMGTGQVAR